MLPTDQDSADDISTQSLGQPDPKAQNDMWKEFRTRIDACKLYRKKLIALWTLNIDWRRGKPFSSQTDEDRVSINLDWSLTKQKQAALFSQVPQVRVDHNPQTLQTPWVHAFEQKLNDTLEVAGIESVMDEVLPDCINAAGIGIAMCSYEAITRPTQVPAIDLSVMPPQFQAQIMQTGMLPNGEPVPMTEVPKTVDSRYVVSRISPADLLWPINFTGSDFDNAAWIGRTGRVSWAQAKQRFNLTDDEKDLILGEDRTTLDRLTHDVDKDKVTADEMVGFDEVFYREYQYDDSSDSYQTIHHLVFVHGKDDAVIDEPWKGQQQDDKAGLLGATKFPIRVLTLSYITDDTIPPSDSAIGRPQINEINKSRTQMIQQRERSLPIRWFDVNRIDPAIQQSLMRGTWQAMIPVQGQGANSIGEVARATMPQENFAFDRVAKSDLQELWSLGPNQDGSGAGIDTAEEARDVQSGFQTRVARERAKVSKFFVSIAEVIGGLLCLFEDPSTFGQGFDKAISRALTYSILADSTVLLDSNQRLKKLIDFVNFSAKSGFIDVEPVLREVATLSGLDPNTVIKKPEPKPPVEPNISLRLTGVEDMLNPMTLAFLMKSGQAPDANLIEQAKQLIAAAMVAPAQAPGQPAPPMGQVHTGLTPPGMAPPIPPAQPPMPMPPPQAGPPPVGQAHPDWQLMSKINKRSGDGDQ